MTLTNTQKIKSFKLMIKNIDTIRSIMPFGSRELDLKSERDDMETMLRQLESITRKLDGHIQRLEKNIKMKSNLNTYYYERFNTYGTYTSDGTIKAKDRKDADAILEKMFGKRKNPRGLNYRFNKI